MKYLYYISIVGVFFFHVACLFFIFFSSLLVISNSHEERERKIQIYKANNNSEFI